MKPNPASIRRHAVNGASMCIVAVLLCSLVTVARAQDDGRVIAMRGVYDKGVVRLRWGSGSTVVWDLIRSNGITLTRQEANDSVEVPLGGEQPLRVWDESRWRSREADIPAAARVVALLRESAKPHAGMTDYARADLEQNTLTAALLMAEFNFDIAQGLALGFLDADARQDGLYRYVLTLPDPAHGDTLTAECFVATDADTPMIPVLGLTAEGGEHSVALSWTRIPEYTGYLVERRPAGDGPWTRLTAVPRVYPENYPDPVLLRDSVPNGKAFEYRVLGVDAFGRVSEPGDPVAVRASDRTPPESPRDLRWEKAGGGVRITWTNPPREPDLAGYAVLRSRSPEQDYRPVHEKLLEPGTESYRDTIAAAGTYFYRLVAADTAGNLSPMSVRAMAVVDDTIPGDSPAGLTAAADTNGVITLRWRHGRADDIAGYRVYRLIGDGSSGEFVPLTPGAIVDTVFTDTLLATVRDRSVYRVRSVDFAGNYSVPGAPVGVTLPDRLPPVVPAILGHEASGGFVRLSFGSPSGDIAAYEIRRTPQGATKADVIERSTSGEWTDRAAKHGVEYRYQVVAVDSAGNRSDPSRPLVVKPFWKEDIRTPPAPTLAVTAGSKPAVTVGWRYPEDREYSAIVFRRKGEGSFFQLSPLLTGTTYRDSTATRGSSYEYTLRFYLAGQGASELGSASKITVP